MLSLACCQVNNARSSGSRAPHTTFVKIITTLPEAKYYKRIESPTPKKFLWEDKSSSAVRIAAEFNPFDRPVTIVISPQKQKSDKSEYPYRLVFKCFESGEGAVPAIIAREQFKGIYCWSQKHSRYPGCGYPLFFGFPREARIHEWLGYSIYLQAEEASNQKASLLA